MTVHVIRCFFLYIAVILAVRIMGKRQIGELQPSELVVTMMLSELAVLPLQDVNMPLLWGLVPMFLMVALELVMSLFTLKSMRFRALCYGRPVMLIYRGHINQHELLRTRVSMEDIMEAMRNNGILSVEDILMAVLETNGMLSIIPKEEAAPPTARDLKISVGDNGGIPAIIVMDGAPVPENMKKKNVDYEEVEKICTGYKVRMKDIFMLTIDDNKKTYMVKKEHR